MFPAVARGLTSLAAVLLIGGLSCPAAAQDTQPDPTPIEEWSHARVGAMGQAIFEQDRAAWVATDALLGQFGGSPPDGLRGWIVVKEPGGQRVRFVRLDGEILKAGWDVPVRNGRAGRVETVSDGTLTEVEAAQFRARTTAAQNIGRLRCSRQLNAVVLDDPESDGWLVWLLTSTSDANIIPVGGHYRFRISADGATVLQRDMLTNSCLNMPRAQAGPQGTPVGMVVSQIVSSGPVETHVFLSLQNRTPIYVSAGDNLFEVNGARIRKVDR
ncbi:MAG TPA: hypothetical protein VLJ13_01430 [Brevundimonas sp.]|nr:hypothetical protein [Brevundimonas sp.]